MPQLASSLLNEFTREILCAERSTAADAVTELGDVLKFLGSSTLSALSFPFFVTIGAKFMILCSE